MENPLKFYETRYSTKEQFTGEYWIDGKPIYRKVYNFTVSDTNEKLISHNIKNISNIWLGNKSYILTGSNHIPVNHYRDSGAFVWTLTNNTSIRIKIGADAWINKPIYITLEYTKTTDAASYEYCKEVALNSLGYSSSDTSVYTSYEGEDDTGYRVCIRRSSDTYAIAFLYVNKYTLEVSEYN